MQIQFPLFVREKDSGNIRSYFSIASMQYAIEKIDVENQEYEAWDANGTPLSLSVQEPIWLDVQPQGVARPDDLAAAIAQIAQSNKLEISPALLAAGQFAQVLNEIHSKLKERARSRSWFRRLLGPG